MSSSTRTTTRTIRCIACIVCKKSCDKNKPSCTRCSQSNTTCIYMTDELQRFVDRLKDIRLTKLSKTFKNKYGTNKKKLRKGFKAIGAKAENYFRKLLQDESKDFKLNQLNATLCEARNDETKMIFDVIESLGTGTKDNQNVIKKKEVKIKSAQILLLALRSVGSERALPNFKRYMDLMFISMGANKALRNYIANVGLGSSKSRAKILQSFTARPQNFPGYATLDNKQVTRHNKGSFHGKSGPTYYLHGMETIVESLDEEEERESYKRNMLESTRQGTLESTRQSITMNKKKLLDENINIDLYVDDKKDKEFYNQVIKDQLVLLKELYEVEKNILEEKEVTEPKEKKRKRTAKKKNNDERENTNDDNDDIGDDDGTDDAAPIAPPIPAVERNISMVTYAGNISSNDGFKSCLKNWVNDVGLNQIDVGFDKGLLVLDGKANVDFHEIRFKLAKLAETQLNDNNNDENYIFWSKLQSLQVVPGDLHALFYILHTMIDADYHILCPLALLLKKYQFHNDSKSIAIGYRMHRDTYLLIGRCSIYAKLSIKSVDIEDLNPFEKRYLFFRGLLLAVRSNDGSMWKEANPILIRIFINSATLHPMYVKIFCRVAEFMDLFGSEFSKENFEFRRFIFLKSSFICRDTFIEFKNYLDKQIGINTDDDFLLVANAAWKLYQVSSVFKTETYHSVSQLKYIKKNRRIDFKLIYNAFKHCDNDVDKLWSYTISKRTSSDNMPPSSSSSALEFKRKLFCRLNINFTEETLREGVAIDNKEEDLNKTKIPPPNKRPKRDETNIFDVGMKEKIKKVVRVRLRQLKKEVEQEEATKEAYHKYLQRRTNNNNNNVATSNINIPNETAKQKLQTYQNAINNHTQSSMLSTIQPNDTVTHAIPSILNETLTQNDIRTQSSISSGSMSPPLVYTTNRTSLSQVGSIFSETKALSNTGEDSRSSDSSNSSDDDY